MIETEQSADVAAPLDQVWSYVENIERWASIMPGYQTCELIDADNSRWVLKVGVGGLIRTVKVKVHIDEWAGPELVRFTYALEGDPVQGSGTYRAEPSGPATTRIALQVRVEGSGPMAPMWEAMGRPLLPQFAKAFAGQLRDEIEKALAGTPAISAAAASPRPAGFLAWLKSLWNRLIGRKDARV